MTMIKSILISGVMLAGVAVATAQNGAKKANSPLLKQEQNLKVTQQPSNLKDAAQNHQGGIQPCGTFSAMETYFKADPAAKARYEALVKADEEANAPSAANRYGNGGPNQVMSPSPYALDTIPVVFHILHTGGPENISNQAIYDALAQINIDYRKMDADTAQINPHFQPRATACNLVFQLATIDPDGNCTNGIIRHYDAHTTWYQDSASSPLYAPNYYKYTGTGTSKWNPTKYLNIYIVQSIVDGGSSGGIVVGYTYLPGTFSTGYCSDAIVYNRNYLDASNKEVRSLAHEMGHWFNLKHTFGMTNSPGQACGDDNIGFIGGVQSDDTPKTLGFFSTCPAQTPNTCDTSNWANVENIMDYSSCPRMFTLGQVKKMRTAAASGTAGRSNLSSAANKVATGIRNPLVCAPVADFSADKHSVCVGTAVTFSDSTNNSVTTSYQWDFPGGTPSSSTAAHPVVTYASPGSYPVTYTATNSAGSDIISKTDFIDVFSTTAVNQTGFVEGFETITVPNADWRVETGNGNPNWTQISTNGATGTHCMMIDNYNNTPGNVEVFYTPTYNMQAINAASPLATFTFKVAYQRKTTSANEKLQVFSSTNCGQTWTARYTKSGQSLATNSATPGTAFVPSSAADWRTESVSVNALLAQQNVMFRFLFTSDGNGNMNNIYVDDININSNPVGLAEAEESMLNINVYPNPTKGNVNVSFDLNNKQNVKLELVDVLGRTVETAVNSSLSSGSYEYTFGAGQKYAAGIYFSKLSIDGKVYTRKVVVE